jgi:hypothetical protein
MQKFWGKAVDVVEFLLGQWRHWIGSLQQAGENFRRINRAVHLIFIPDFIRNQQDGDSDPLSTSLET